MNKKLIVILLATLLFIGGTSSVLADESQESTESSKFEITEPVPSEPPPTLSGIGNGGGGNPG